VGCLTRLGQIGEDIAVLLSERCHDCQQRFDKPGPISTLRSKAAFAPQHARADGVLGGIIRWLHAFDTHKCP
jgi:hypothetical protein